MDKNTIIYLCGLHSLFFAAFHIAFWKLFRWPSSLKGLGRVNRAILQILNIRLIYIFLLSSFFCFFFTRDLYATPFGRAFLIGMAVFWLGRTLEQFILLRVNHWLAHLLTVLFVTGTIIFLLPLIGSRSR